jgi:hypothetical protein
MLAKGDGSFQSFKAGKAGNTIFGVRLNFLACGMIQFAVDVFRKFFQHFQAMFMIMVVIAH